MNAWKVTMVRDHKITPEMPGPHNLCDELCIMNLHIYSFIYLLHVFTES